MADGDHTRFPQVSKPAVSPISSSAGRRGGEKFAGYETRNNIPMTAGEVCGTGWAAKYPL